MSSADCRKQARDKSPSSRRAWIEIAFKIKAPPLTRGSPSSRRAWIEIHPTIFNSCQSLVALLAEGVDRNQLATALATIDKGRPPRGGRG